jgi:DNA-entry nuclease
MQVYRKPEGMKESIKNKAGYIKKAIIVISLILALLVVAVLVKSCITYYMQEKAAGVQFLEDEPSKSIVEADPSLIPDYSGKDVIELKGNIPCFTIYDQDHIEGESFSDLDSLGRCGVAYAMTGQNANEKNLITGTRYFNAELMLTYELKVLKYLDDSNNHVLYRVTPYFKDGELLARGVEMEAYSIEDNGKGVCFHVFCYNVQPGIEIDYMTGENRADEQ